METVAVADSSANYAPHHANDAPHHVNDAPHHANDAAMNLRHAGVQATDRWRKLEMFSCMTAGASRPGATQNHYLKIYSHRTQSRKATGSLWVQGSTVKLKGPLLNHA